MESPISHAVHHWDREKRILSFEYNGYQLITIAIPERDEVGFRRGSDGILQSFPFVQQLYVKLEDTNRRVIAKVTFQLGDDTINMRPFRAGPEQAILGQVGRPLIYGVNGLYDIKQDLLISWHGCKWNWTEERLIPGTNSNLIAHLEVELGPSPWFINIRPQYYRTHLGFHYHKPWEWRPNLKPIAGWCSWEAYRRDITEENIEKATRFFARHFKPYGLEYIQIDDGYEKTPVPFDPKSSIAEAWLKPNEKFPSGHKGIVNNIKSYGMQPGIWTTTGINNGEFAKEQADCLIKEDSKPLVGEWIGYILDCSPSSLKRHVYPCYKGLKETGYTYLKIDGLRHLIYDGLEEAVRRGIIDNEEAKGRFRAFLECVRKAIGNRVYFLSSWGILTEAAGIVDACRIAMDAQPNWPGIYMQLVESARWFHTQRILWVNDPDHICVRTKQEWARTMLSLASLSGSLFMLSDDPKEYDEERIRIIQQCLPPLNTVAGETGPLSTDYVAFAWTKLHGFAFDHGEGPFKPTDISVQDALNMAGGSPIMDDDHPFSSLWAFHFDTSAGQWCAVIRIATVPLHASELFLDDVGLNPDFEYLVFDFWKQEYIGRFSGKLPCRKLELGHCQILSLRPVLDHPQFLASSRHVSMDAVSLKSQDWSNNKLILELSTVSGTEETYWFHVPKGFALDAIAVEDTSLIVGECRKETLPIGIKTTVPKVVLQMQFKTKGEIYGFTF